MPDVPINREGPQAREPSKCLNRQSYRERLAQKTCLSATRGSKKDSDRAITPAAETVHVPAHLVLPGSLQARQLYHLHAQLSLGQSCYRQKSLASMCTGSLWPCPTLSNLVDCGLPGFSVREGLLCQRGGSLGKNTGAYWPILVAIPF